MRFAVAVGEGDHALTVVQACGIVVELFRFTGHPHHKRRKADVVRVNLLKDEDVRWRFHVRRLRECPVVRVQFLRVEGPPHVFVHRVASHMRDFADVWDVHGSLVFRTFVNGGGTQVGTEKRILRINQQVGVGECRIIEVVITRDPEFPESAFRCA